MASKTPRLLRPDQRALFTRVPDLTAREIARHYTFSSHDLSIIARHRRRGNRLGFAVQLALLRFPGRALTDLPEVPAPLLTYIADQVGVPVNAFDDYGQRENTLYEHLDEIRREFGYHTCGWAELRRLGRGILPLALESDRALPLIEAALERLRTDRVIAPGITTVERVVWIVLRLAERRITRYLLGALSPEQRALLDTLLHGDPELHGRTRLTWLRAAPEIASAKSLRRVLERLAFVRALHLPSPSARLHPHRRRQLARRCAQYEAQPLAKLAPDRRHTLLAAYLVELGPDLTDQALDMFDKMMGELVRKGERKQDLHLHRHARTLNASLHVLTTATDAFLTARRDGLDPFATVFDAVPESILETTVAAAKTLVRPVDLDSLDLIEPKYVRMRAAVLDLYAALDITAVRGADPALDALDYVLAMAQYKRRVTHKRQTVDGQSIQAPLGHVTDRWRRHVVRGRKINANYYEAAAFEALKGGLRAGDLAVAGSHRYRSFDSYLLPKERWRTLRDAGETRLVLTSTAQEYLATRQQQITEALVGLHRDLDSLPGLSVDAQGQLHLAALDADTPADVKAVRQQVYRKLPLIPLSAVLQDVDEWTGCFDHLTHLSSSETPTGERRMMVLAAVMGLGMNLGLGATAASTPFTYRQLAWAADWHIREETLTKAQATLDNFVLHHPLARAWGDGTHSSSDGMRVKVGVRAANAERNAAHFGPDRGATIYAHIADVGPPFAQKVISTNDREALHVIDALCSHETDLDIQEHYTDTHGYTTHVFALCALLGFRFAPRISDVLAQRLYTIGRPGDYGPFNALLKGRVNVRVITANWDEVQRVAASIRHGSVSAALIMRKLAAYPRQNQVAHALHEVGQIEKTAFILELLRDEQLRRRVQRGLNKGELVNSAARALFFGQRGEFRDRAFQDQVHRASCLHLLIAAIAAWTTPYVEDAIAAVRAEGIDVPEEYIAHISPIAWEHVHLLGQYTFDPGAARSLEERRPLRTGTEYVDADADEPSATAR